VLAGECIISTLLTAALRITRAPARATGTRACERYTHVERGRWILVSQREGSYGTEVLRRREKGNKGPRKTVISRVAEGKREGEREREIVQLHARDGSFIIAFSCVVCATVSCSLITMIHFPPASCSLARACRSVSVTSPALNPHRRARANHASGGRSGRRGGGTNAYESSNIITRDGERRRVSANTRMSGNHPGERGRPGAAHYIYLRRGGGQAPLLSSSFFFFFFPAGR